MTVFFLPMESATGPRKKAPSMTPPMKKLIVNGPRYALSHTRSHSEARLLSLSTPGNSIDWHLSAFPSGHFDMCGVS